jgi:tetratricopeptide (TPR) repeat protein
VHRHRGELEEALGNFREALAIEKSKRGACSIQVAKLLNLMGNIHLQFGNVNELMACYTEASRIYKKCGESENMLVIAGHNFYGLAKLCPVCAPVA